jgi:hypothetical protein
MWALGVIKRHRVSRIRHGGDDAHEIGALHVAVPCSEDIVRSEAAALGPGDLRFRAIRKSATRRVTQRRYL